MIDRDLIIGFDCHGVHAPHYSCSHPSDSTGTYVPISAFDGGYALIRSFMEHCEYREGGVANLEQLKKDFGGPVDKAIKTLNKSRIGFVAVDDSDSLAYACEVAGDQSGHYVADHPTIHVRESLACIDRFLKGHHTFQDVIQSIRTAVRRIDA